MLGGRFGDARPPDRCFPAIADRSPAGSTADEVKNQARDELAGIIQPPVRRLQAEANVDDGERAAMGITVPDRVATTGEKGPRSETASATIGA